MGTQKAPGRQNSGGISRAHNNQRLQGAGHRKQARGACYPQRLTKVHQPCPMSLTTSAARPASGSRSCQAPRGRRRRTRLPPHPWPARRRPRRPLRRPRPPALGPWRPGRSSGPRPRLSIGAEYRVSAGPASSAVCSPSKSISYCQLPGRSSCRRLRCVGLNPTPARLGRRISRDGQGDGDREGWVAGTHQPPSLGQRQQLVSSRGRSLMPGPRWCPSCGRRRERSRARRPRRLTFGLPGASAR